MIIEIKKERGNKKMTRKEVIEKSMEKIVALIDNYTWDSYAEVVDMISDFNSSHTEEEEIFFAVTEEGYILEGEHIVVEN